MKKLLFVKISALGDAFDSSPIPESINKNHNIHFVVSEQSCSALARNKLIKKYFIIDLFNSSSLALCRSLLSVAIKIFIENIIHPYDAVYIFHCNSKIPLFLRLLGLRRIYRFSHVSQSKYIQKYRVNINRTVQEIQLLRRSGLSVETPECLSFFPDPKSHLYSLPKHLNTSDTLISLVIGGGNSLGNANTRSLRHDFIVDLIKRYSKKYTFALLGKGDDDFKRQQYIVGEFTSKKYDHLQLLPLVNETSLSEVFQIFRCSKAIIAGDTGLSKAAAASGSPVLIIFGPTASSLAAPLGDNVTSFCRNTLCSSCYDPRDGINSQMYSCLDATCMPNSGECVDFFFSNLG